MVAARHSQSIVKCAHVFRGLAKAAAAMVSEKAQMAEDEFAMHESRTAVFHK
jgi:hypothetical protein